MAVSLALAGDVMTGRGIDQILRSPSPPAIFEPVVRDAREYVALAEAANGPIPRGVGDAYPWGDALPFLVRSAARIVNLETAVTRSERAARKTINYRMHPANVGCLAVAGIDVCGLANNHALDYGEAGLVETLDTLASAGIQVAGAGRTREEAWRPARVALGDGGAVLVSAVAARTSGVPADWGAAPDRPGLAVLPDLSGATAARLLEALTPARRPGDILVVSIHWGGNWGHAVAPEERAFAHRLIDGGADVVHGHSAHHPRPIEVHAGRLALYGCGDFVNDYEGIGGHEAYRGELRLLYLPALDADGALAGLRMLPFRARRFRLARADPADAEWLAWTLSRVSAPFGSRIDVAPDGCLELRWGAAAGRADGRA
ncbi:MAG TPA: CapA family protein [Methylomirabilota bacterium]|nr:CapA family protein [Methylomirabilota bacterium]